MSGTAHHTTDGTPEPGDGRDRRTDRAQRTDHTDRAATTDRKERQSGKERQSSKGRQSSKERQGGKERRRGSRRPPGRRDQRHSLRREAPTVLGLLPDDAAFAAMREQAGFPFEDYADYLREVDRFLHGLDSGGTHVRVTLFDPDDYADYCASTRQPADAPATRARYTAEATTTGPGVRYTRQDLDDLRGELSREAARRATWEGATDLLLDAGTCARCGRDLAHCAFDHASQTLLRIVDVLGPGTHHAVTSLPVEQGPPLTAAATIEAHDDGSVHFAEPDALVLCTVMAATSAVTHAAGLAIRTTAPDGTETVRGWSLRGGNPQPLTAAQVFDAYCTDPATGDPVPPEPGLHYAAGFPVPPEAEPGPGTGTGTGTEPPPADAG